MGETRILCLVMPRRVVGGGRARSTRLSAHDLLCRVVARAEPSRADRTVDLESDAESAPTTVYAMPTKPCRTIPRAVQPGRALAVGAWSSPDAWSVPARACSRSVAS
jgi:hypothetical protein